VTTATVEDVTEQGPPPDEQDLRTLAEIGAALGISPRTLSTYRGLYASTQTPVPDPVGKRGRLDLHSLAAWQAWDQARSRAMGRPKKGTRLWRCPLAAEHGQKRCPRCGRRRTRTAKGEG
jgi:hypothetical protein